MLSKLSEYKNATTDDEKLLAKIKYLQGVLDNTDDGAIVTKEKLEYNNENPSVKTEDLSGDETGFIDRLDRLNRDYKSKVRHSEALIASKKPGELLQQVYDRIVKKNSQALEDYDLAKKNAQEGRQTIKNLMGTGVYSTNDQTYVSWNDIKGGDVENINIKKWINLKFLIKNAYGFLTIIIFTYLTMIIL